MELIDQTALITGGTTAIGSAYARLRAREGTSALASPRASFITGSTLHADGGGTAI